MSVQPFIVPKFRAFDSNGDPLAGGKLYSYSAGTSTPLSTYTTRAGNIANANPVILDANGEADVWTTPGVNYKFILKNSADVTQWTVDNVPSIATVDTAANVATEPGGRLTLTTATPVTTSDVTGATTVYYTPHKHNRIPVYNGTDWVLETFAELSQTTTDTTKSPAAVASNSNYDLYVWNDAGTIRLSRSPAWTSDTARGSGAGTPEIARLNGRYVNAVSITNGPAANRGTYVGTVRSDGSAQINDSLAKQHLWNTYNRVRREMAGAAETTDDWGYSSATIRQANANAANQLDFVRGLAEDAVEATVQVSALAVGSNTNATVGIGLDSTTAFSGFFTQFQAATAQYNTARASYGGTPGIGRHYLAWLECGLGSGTIEWYGDRLGGGTATKNGIFGSTFA